MNPQITPPHEHQLSLMFEDTPQLPEAILNDVGVMITNVLQRSYIGARSTMGFKDSVKISVGHHGGRWAAGLSVRIDTEYCGCSPSFKWSEFDSMADAIDGSIDDAVEKLRRKMTSEYADAKAKAGAAELLEMIMKNKFSEKVIELFYSSEVNYGSS